MSRGGRRKRGKSSGRPKAPKENSPKEDSPKENKESPQAKQSKQQPTSSAPRPVQVLMVIPPPPPPSVLILPPVTVQSNCSFGKVTVTLDEEGPLSPDEDMAFTAMLRRKLEGSSDKTFVAKTGGKPMRFMHTPQLEKTSTDAAPSTVAKRARMLESMREQVSGGNGEHQLMAEMKRYPKDQLFQMLDKAGLAQIRIPTGHLLGLKTDIQVNHGQLRKLKRWLDQYGVATESERRMRQTTANLLSAYEVTAELLPFSVKTDDDEVIIALRPCAYIFSLPSAVFDYLERSKRAKTLEWPGPTMTDEIWLKIGGDHGGGSFKMAYQLLHKTHPNTAANTTVFAIFEAKDSRDNLKTALGRYRAEVEALQKEKWQGEGGHAYNLRVFIAGDYAFLSTIYGLSGASGSHPCLWCQIRKSEIDDQDSQRLRLPPRTLENMAQDYWEFLHEGRGNIKHAQNYHNIISPPMFRVPIEQVIVPGLHISLGIFHRLYTELEATLQGLDRKVEKYLHMIIRDGETDREEILDDPHLARFQAYVAAIDKAQVYEEQAKELQEEIEEQETQLAWLAYDNQGVNKNMHEVVFKEATSMVTALINRRDNLERKAGAILTEASLKPGKGPFCSKLDPVLQEFHVQRQAYHGKSFIGNHVDKMLQDKPIEALTGVVEKTVTEILDEHPTFPLALLSAAMKASKKYEKLFKLFGSCHRLYSTSKSNITAFMDTYREESRTVSIKMHILEHHVVPCIRRWGFGLGFLAEQGIEKLHSHFNSLSRSTRSIPDPVARLKSTLNNHLLTVSPDHGKAISSLGCWYGRWVEL
ncbi:hypothetical protein Bbelb_272460 [Branchiostoma belcheri]|nr:hypothetical protein Bbelb_272460 [Branchiostoma belcheri]